MILVSVGGFLRFLVFVAVAAAVLAVAAVSAAHSDVTVDSVPSSHCSTQQVPGSGRTA